MPMLEVLPDLSADFLLCYLEGLPLSKKFLIRGLTSYVKTRQRTQEGVSEPTGSQDVHLC